MRYLPRILLFSYLFLLLWLILFKLSFDFSRFVTYSFSNTNLVPFSTFSLNNPTILRETMYNLIVFVPLGVLLPVNYKQVSFWKKLVFIFLLSLSAEMIQFFFHIGVADVTDLITNTTGGLLGLLSYQGMNRFLGTKKLDRLVVILGFVLLLFLVTFFLLMTLTRRLQLQ
ncbi:MULTISPECIES: VanZ family protein [unclassified Enterococcus]|uniref:VanZ family protein n=1 Tax=unclassified Enterococcus TaxID=2608891 RepID=UPI0013EAB777|nr:MULTISPECIES: VanZ family protein [unclassified Enterococcus]